MSSHMKYFYSCFLILVINCVVDLTSHRVYKIENETWINQETSDEAKSSELGKSEYWTPWRCTDRRLEFLKLFYPLLQNLTCLGENGHRYHPLNKRSPNLNDQQVDFKSSEPKGQEIENVDNEIELMVHQLDVPRMKRLRGCKWENQTHFCHQHILFVIEHPRCTLIKDKSEEISGDDDGNLDGVVDDLLMLESEKPSSTKVWIYGFICCTLTIVLARVGVIILPLLRKDLYEKLIITMVGLAAGTLMGSSIFHLLPKAFSLEEKFEGHTYLSRCVVISFGLWAFFLLERILKIIFYHKERRFHGRRLKQVSNVLAQPDGNPISFVSVTKSSSFKDKINQKIISESEQEKKLPNSTDEKDDLEPPCDKCAEQIEDEKCSVSDKYRLQSNELHVIGFQESRLSQVSTEAWMIIIADSFLDFVDGLSIGTAFHDSILTGLSISLGILLEEVPHELGEFAVLLNAGLPFRHALLFKFLASCSTYLGLCVGIWLGRLEASPYVFSLASGMFLYIALADMIPELNQVALKSSRLSVRKGFRVLLLQNLGLFLGIAIIYIMSTYEKVFQKLG